MPQSSISWADDLASAQDFELLLSALHALSVVWAGEQIPSDGGAS